MEKKKKGTWPWKTSKTILEHHSETAIAIIYIKKPFVLVRVQVKMSTIPVCLCQKGLVNFSHGYRGYFLQVQTEYRLGRLGFNKQMYLSAFRETTELYFGHVKFITSSSSLTQMIIGDVIETKFFQEKLPRSVYSQIF